MIRMIFTVAVSLLSAPASAQDAPLLWQGLKVGMSKQEVSGDYRKGSLVRVVLRFGDLMAASRQSWDQGLECQRIVRASIVSRYGEPADVGRRVFEGEETGDKMLWLIGDVTIEFYTQDRRPFTVIQYKYTPNAKPVVPSAADKL